MEIEYQSTGMIPAEDRASLLSLNRLLFGAAESDWIQECEAKPGVVWVYAKAGAQVVGYKVGYERKPGQFYSWLGGVHADFRRQGIASRLIELQHQVCRDRGYATVRTKTKNKWRGMLILNLKHGFDVIGCYTDKEGEPKILLEKKLQ